MKLTDFDFVEAASVRRAVVPAGDIRGDIAFQNDINVIMAGLDARNPPFTALGWMRQPVSLVPAAMSRDHVTDMGLRVLKGGGIRTVVASQPRQRSALGRQA